MGLSFLLRAGVSTLFVDSTYLKYVKKSGFFLKLGIKIAEKATTYRGYMPGKQLCHVDLLW
jgi:hypothetical protein